MAFKRYVHKKGKRHGPYYYKNVRDHMGKVKTVYLGKASARGKRPLEIAIVFLSALFVIISALFLTQNRSLMLSKQAAEEDKIPFETDQILIKVLVREEEYVEKELRVMNVGNEEESISIEVEGIPYLTNVMEKEFTIKPGQTKISRINFTSYDKNANIGQAPGVYIGKITAKSDSYQKEIPLIVEIESKNVLFDMNLNPAARDRSILQGESTTFEIKVFNLQSIESYNIDMEFFVKDINGNTIVSEKESVVVKTQASFFKTLKIPESLKTGSYVFVAQASFGKSVGTASYLFDVGGRDARKNLSSRFFGFCKNDILCWSLSAIALLLIFSIGAYAYFFAGALIYEKMFPGRMGKRKAEEMLLGKQERKSIAQSFIGIGNWVKKMGENALKRKLEREKQRKKLAGEKKSLLKERQRAEERKKEEKLLENRRKEIARAWGTAKRSKKLGKCKALIKRGSYELNKGYIRKADHVYIKVIGMYSNLEDSIKPEIFNDINSFYKALLVKKSQIRDKAEKDRKKAEEEKKRKAEESEKRREQRKKSMFEALHALGLIRTKEDQEKLRKEKEEQELRAEDQKKLRIKEEEKKRRLRQGEEKRKLAQKLELKAKRKKELLEAKKRIYKFLHNIGLLKTKEEQEQIRKERKMEKLQEAKISEQEEKRRKKEEEARQKEEAKIIQQQERQGQKELAEQQKKEEKGKKEEQRQIALENRIREQEERKKQQEIEMGKRGEEKQRKLSEEKKKQDERERKILEEEKGKRLEDINSLEKGINENNSKIAGLREKISNEQQSMHSMEEEILSIQNGIEKLRNEKDALLRARNKSIESEKELRKGGDEKVKEWEQRYNEKIKEKDSLANEIKQIYESKLKEIENELEKLSPEERAEVKKWKKLELKADCKLHEKEREKELQEQINLLLEEKKSIKREFKDKKQNALNKISEKEAIENQKGIDESIRQQEKKLESLKENIVSKHLLIEKHKAGIEKLEEENRKAKNELFREKGLVGIRHISSWFNFREKQKIVEQKKEPAQAEATAKKEPNLMDAILKARQEKDDSTALKRDGKSRKFIKCHKLMVRATEAFSNNDIVNAKRAYLKALDIYAKLEYEEKKEIYNELNELYNKLKRGR